MKDYLWRKWREEQLEMIRMKKEIAIIFKILFKILFVIGVIYGALNLYFKIYYG